MQSGYFASYDSSLSDPDSRGKSTINGVPNFCHVDLRREGTAWTTLGAGAVVGPGEVTISNPLLQRRYFKRILSQVALGGASRNTVFCVTTEGDGVSTTFGLAGESQER